MFTTPRVHTLRAVHVLGTACLLLATCTDDHQMPVYPGPSEPVATFDGWSERTRLGFMPEDTVMMPSLDGVEYTYTGDATLSLRHVNAVFNCSPGEIRAAISFEDSLIIIEESELSSAGTHTCFYELTYTIRNLRPRPYRLRIVEPYLPLGDTPLDFVLDLSRPISGRRCEERTSHPWFYIDWPPPMGRLTAFSGCKHWRETPDDSIAVTRDCLAFTYDRFDVLRLRHINAGFNCCPGEITASVQILGNVISILESEAAQECRCQCLYDLDFRIQGLYPGLYEIRVVEPYVHSEWGEARLGFLLDLTVPTSDTLCVERTRAPWGW